MALGMGITFRCHSLIPAIISIFIGGVGDGISNVVFNTTLMKESPDEIRGRVFGSTIALVYTTVALGMAAAGFFIDRYPLGFTTDWSSLIIIIGVIAGFIIFNRGKAKQNENILKY